MESWRRDGVLYPFTASQSIATRYFSQFAFGALPAEPESRAIAQASLISNEVMMRVTTSPRHILGCPRKGDLYARHENETLNVKGQWIQKLIAERIEKNLDKSICEMTEDLLDIILKRAVVSRGGKSEGTLIGQVTALGEKTWASVLEQTANEVSILLTGATASTPTLITYAMYIVVHNEELQEQLRAELRQCSDELCGRKPVDTLLKIPVLNEIVSQSLIQYPPVPFAFPRQMVGNTVFQDIEFKKGDILLFDLSKLEQPFHKGKYTCIGFKVAEIEAKMILAQTVRSFHIKPSPELSLIPEPMPSSIVRAPKVDIPLLATCHR